MSHRKVTIGDHTLVSIRNDKGLSFISACKSVSLFLRHKYFMYDL